MLVTLVTQKVSEIAPTMHQKGNRWGKRENSTLVTQDQLELLLCQRKDEVDFSCASACLANFFVGKYWGAKNKR